MDNLEFEKFRPTDFPDESNRFTTDLNDLSEMSLKYREEGETGDKLIGVENQISSLERLKSYLNGSHPEVVVNLIKGWKDAIINNKEIEQKPEYILRLYPKVILELEKDFPDLKVLEQFIVDEIIYFGNIKLALNKAIEKRRKN